MRVPLTRCYSRSGETTSSFDAEASGVDVEQADDADWPREYLDLVLAVKVVSGMEQAIEHIVTENYTHAQAFLRRVNSSTQKFTVLGQGQVRP